VVAVDGLRSNHWGFDANAPVHERRDLFENLDDRVLAGLWWRRGIRASAVRLEQKLPEAWCVYSSNGGAIRHVRAACASAAALPWAIDRCVGDGVRPYRLVHGCGKVDGCWTFQRIGARRAVQASDFLMALQLTGAAKFSSIANLQIRLPVV